MTLFQPIWKYHPDHGAKLCKTELDLSRLGDGWQDSRTFKKPEPVIEKSKSVKPEPKSKPEMKG